MRPEEVSGRALAFLGDAAWSLLVREYLIEHGYARGSDLQRLAVTFVSARAQAEAYDFLHAEGFFSEQEEAVFKRGRNDSAGTVPRNTPAPIYRKSTGFEAILGDLKLRGEWSRIDTIFNRVRARREEKNGTIGLREKRGKADPE